MNYKINNEIIEKHLIENNICKEQFCKTFGIKAKVVQRLIDAPITKVFELALYQDELIMIANELGKDVKDLII